MSEQATQAKKEILNGVNVAVVEGLIDAVNEKPDLAESKFRVSKPCRIKISCLQQMG